jgi:ribonucleoside-triphosphate reductase
MEITMKVIKRNGKEVEFDKSKIVNAIYKAFKAVGEGEYKQAVEIADEVTNYVEKNLEGIASVEQIQDIVEQYLIKRGHAKAAKAYILYRKQHQDIREFKKMFMDIEKMVDEYIGKLDWRVNENSNMSYSLQGLNNHISSTITAHYWLNKIYPLGRLSTFSIHFKGKQQELKLFPTLILI